MAAGMTRSRARSGPSTSAMRVVVRSIIACDASTAQTSKPRSASSTVLRPPAQPRSRTLVAPGSSYSSISRSSRWSGSRDANCSTTSGCSQQGRSAILSPAVCVDLSSVLLKGRNSVMLDAILLANSQEETRRMRPTVCSFAAAAFAALVLTGCDADSPPARPDEDGSEQSVDDSEARLIPQTAGFDQVRALALDPHSAELPDDSLLAGQIRRGFDIITNTPVHAPRYSGNAMTCANCHLNAGQRERALPLVAVAAVFPVSRAREGRLFSLEDRIRGCFMRSMNGTAPPYDSEELLAVSAYIHWLSRGQSLGESPPWRGLNTIPEESRLAIDRLDPVL